MSGRDFVAIGLDYARQVTAGNVAACKWVRLACARQLDDLARKEWRYTFDAERAAHVCRFLELLPHVRGEWAGTPLRLEPWQCFKLTTVFGWIDASGCRRFKKVYDEVPRKNAKSTLLGGIGLYLTTADNEPGAEVYSAASTRDQARIVWSTAAAMARRAPGLRLRFGLEVGAHALTVRAENSSFRPLSRDQGGNLDGLNLSGGLVDEFHAHRDRGLWDVLTSAMGSREQPLLWAITTAGFNRAGICYEERAYACRVLDGRATDDEYFAIIYTIDEGDDWRDPEVWRKANPNWGVSVKPEAIEREARKAQQMASAQNNFLTKHLNLWVNAATAWMDLAAWDACADPSLRLENFAGRECVLGLDLASKIDIASKAYLFREGDGYVLFVHHYLPRAAVESSRNSQYDGWMRDGWLRVNEGEITDLDQIESEALADCSRFQVLDLAFDPHQAVQMMGHLMRDGAPVIEVRPTVLNFSEPMKTFEALVKAKRIRHNGDPVMTWMIANVVCFRDAKDNIYPRKEREENKIDGVVAVLMCLARYLAPERATPEYQILIYGG